MENTHTNSETSLHSLGELLEELRCEKDRLERARLASLVHAEAERVGCLVIGRDLISNPDNHTQLVGFILYSSPLSWECHDLEAGILDTIGARISQKLRKNEGYLGFYHPLYREYYYIFSPNFSREILRFTEAEISTALSRAQRREKRERLVSLVQEINGDNVPRERAEKLTSEILEIAKELDLYVFYGDIHDGNYVESHLRELYSPLYGLAAKISDEQVKEIEAELEKFLGYMLSFLEDGHEGTIYISEYKTNTEVIEFLEHAVMDLQDDCE